MCVSVTGGVKVGLAPSPLLTPRLSEFGLIWAIHSISLLSMSHCKYNEWFFKVEICEVGSKMVTTTCFSVTGGVKVGIGPWPLFTPRFSEFGLIQAIHSISTLPMSHC